MAEEGALGADVTDLAANQMSAGNDGKSVGESAGDVGPAIEGLAGTVATDVAVSAGAGPAFGLVGKILEKTGLAKLGAKVGGRVLGYAKGKLDDAWAAARRKFSQCDAPKGVGEGMLTAAEHAEIQAIAKKYNTTIDVVGSRAAGEGRGLGTNYPVGKGPRTRSDIDFRIDTKHPQVQELMDELNKVSGGAGNASMKHGTDHRPTYPPSIRIMPGE